jgi:hypothetical protein
MDTALKIQDKWKTDWNRPLQVPTNNAFNNVRPQPSASPLFKNPKQTFTRPPKLINLKAPSMTQMDEVVEYALDAKDMEWLLDFNEAQKQHSLSPNELEAVIDRLEKDSFYHLNTHKLVLEPATPQPRKKRRMSAAELLGIPSTLSPFPVIPGPLFGARSSGDGAGPAEDGLPKPRQRKPAGKDAIPHRKGAAAAARAATAAAAEAEAKAAAAAAANGVDLNALAAIKQEEEQIAAAAAANAAMEALEAQLNAQKMLEEAEAAAAAEAALENSGDEDDGTATLDQVHFLDNTIVDAEADEDDEDDEDDEEDDDDNYDDEDGEHDGRGHNSGNGELPCGLVIAHEPVPGADPFGMDGNKLTIGRASCEEDLLRSVSIPAITERLQLPVQAINYVARHWIESRRRRKWRPLLRRFYRPSPREWMISQAPTLKYRYEMSLTMRHKFEKLRMLVDLAKKREETKKQLAENLQDAFMVQVGALGELVNWKQPGGKKLSAGKEQDIKKLLASFDDVFLVRNRAAEFESTAEAAAFASDDLTGFGMAGAEAYQTYQPIKVNLGGGGRKRPRDPSAGDEDASGSGSPNSADEDELPIELRERLTDAISSKNEQELSEVLDDMRQQGISFPAELIPPGLDVSNSQPTFNHVDMEAPSGLGGFLHKIAVFCGVSDS